jgi:alkyl sulfatase BDS1-like metallo-beta-lactamase superfamily hydrolase
VRVYHWKNVNKIFQTFEINTSNVSFLKSSHGVIIFPSLVVHHAMILWMDFFAHVDDFL